MGEGVIVLECRAGIKELGTLGPGIQNEPLKTIFSFGRSIYTAKLGGTWQSQQVPGGVSILSPHIPCVERSGACSALGTNKG